MWCRAEARKEQWKVLCVLSTAAVNASEFLVVMRATWRTNAMWKQPQFSRHRGRAEQMVLFISGWRSFSPAVVIERAAVIFFMSVSGLITKMIKVL